MLHIHHSKLAAPELHIVFKLMKVIIQLLNFTV